MTIANVTSRPGLSMGRRYLGAAAGAIFLALGVPAAKAETYASSSTTGTLGTLVVDGTQSKFRLTAPSTVTKISGTGIWLGSSGASAPTVQVSCSRPPGNCNGTYTVTVAANTPLITAFNISNVTSSGATVTGPTSQNVSPITFTIAATNPSFSVSFRLGFDLNASTTTPGPSTGNKNWAYTVTMGH